MRIGHGLDVHRVSDDPSRSLWLGLVEIPDAPGLVGHSDADAATHALCDALLGAANLGDLGRHFPDSDPQFAGSSSRRLLEETVDLVAAAGLRTISADITIVAERPKLADFMPRMSDELSAVVGALVTVKATTAEGLGALGRVEGIGASAVALLEEIVVSPRPAPRKGPPGRSSRQGGRPMTGGQVGGPRRAPSGREKEGLGGEQVEGRHAVLELLKARRRQIQKIYVADAQDASETLDAIEFEAQRQRVPVQVISMARLDREARTEGHQGVMAIAARLETVTLDELLEHRHPFLAGL